jgi:hypothetical protein
MSGNLILIPTALENGKEITTPRSQKNNQSESLFIHSHTAIDLLAIGNTSAYNPCLQTNTVNASLDNSLAMNAGGVA